MASSAEKRKEPASSDGEDSDGLRAFIADLMAKQEARLTAAISGVRAEYQQEVQTLKQEVQALLARVEASENEMAQLKGAAERQDRASRACHLVVKGLAEAPNDHPNLEGVPALFPGCAATVVEAFRLGRPREGAGALPRPVLVKFSSVSAKHAALKHSKDLRNRRIYLDNDLTQLQRDQRTRKRDRYQQLKAQGMKPFWRDERLFFYENGRIREDRVPPPAAPASPAPPPPAPSGAPLSAGAPAPAAGPSYAQVAAP